MPFYEQTPRQEKNLMLWCVVAVGLFVLFVGLYYLYAENQYHIAIDLKIRFIDQINEPDPTGFSVILNKIAVRDWITLQSVGEDRIAIIKGVNPATHYNLMIIDREGMIHDVGLLYIPPDAQDPSILEISCSGMTYSNAKSSCIIISNSDTIS